MGLLDDAKNKLTGLVDAHGEQAGQAVDQAGDLVDEQTGGQFAGQVDSGQELAKNALDGLDHTDDDIS